MFICSLTNFAHPEIYVVSSGQKQPFPSQLRICLQSAHIHPSLTLWLSVLPVALDFRTKLLFQLFGSLLVQTRKLRVIAKLVPRVYRRDLVVQLKVRR